MRGRPVPARLAPNPETRPASIGQTTYQQLREMILQRQMEPGVALQEKRLAEILGVSRTPVREALSRLASEGLVSLARGASPVVRRLSVDEFIEILFIRRILEVEAAGRAAASGDAGDLPEIRRTLEEFLGETRPNVKVHMQTDDLLHATVASLAGSPLLRSMIEELRMKTHVFDMGRIPERFVPGVHEHLEIVDAIMAHDVERAQSAMRTHIENAKNSIVADLQRLFV